MWIPRAGPGGVVVGFEAITGVVGADPGTDAGGFVAAGERWFHLVVVRSGL